MERIDAVVNCTPIRVKINIKLTNFMNNHELNSIVVNKGSILRDLLKFNQIE